MKRLKEIISAAVFCAIFLSLFYIVDTTLSFKYNDGIRVMMDLKRYPENSVDVLFLGSSHIGINIDTEQLCNDYGIAAYKAWGPTQPTWNAYYTLVDTLERQTPKVIVFETLSLSHDLEFQTYSDSIKNVQGLSWSMNKIKAIWDSVLPEYRLDALTGFTTYHSRYASLTDEDFHCYFWNYRFAEQNTKNWHQVYRGSPPVQTQRRVPMGEKELKFLKKILELCRRKDIPILFVSAPYSIPEEENARQNTARDYLREKGYPYLDYITNYADIGIDFDSDFGDASGHLNSTGIQKFTAAIGEYLRANYDLPERYGDPYFAYSVPSDAAYVLLNPFTGDGEKTFITTDTKLYSDPSASWTVLSKIGTHCDSAGKVYFSCFSETAPYRGLLVRGTDDGRLDVIVGENYYCSVDLPQDRAYVTLAISKNGSRYNIYLDGKKVYAYIESNCDSYSGTLTIGSQWMSNGQLGSLSAVTVEELEVYLQEKSEAEILKWMTEHAYVPTAQEMEEYYTKQDAASIVYQMGKAFYGDGQSYINTGIQLYRNPDQNWTLTANLALPENELDGVYFACFSEEPDHYRGLLVRKVGQELQILLGNSQMLTRRLFGGGNLDLTITKSGDKYEVFIGGVSIGTVTSACDSYVGPLMIGCELDTNYQPFRQTFLTVNRLEIADTVATREEIASPK